MKLQQLKYIWEVAQHELNVSVTAQSLYTSQPGISKQIRMLEDELGVEIFSRSGKHLTHITPAGQAILGFVKEILLKVENIKQVSQEISGKNSGMSIATTNNHARNVLPAVIERFIPAYPNVSLHMHQGSSLQVAQMAADGHVDFAITSESIESFSDLIWIPCYRWNHVLILPKQHALSAKDKPSLLEIVEYPILTYASAFSGRSKVDSAFLSQGLSPKVVFTASDTDVIETYVRLGMGVGVVSCAASHELDERLVKVDVSHLFDCSVTCIGFKKGMYVRSYMYDFIEKFAPHLSREVLEQMISCSDQREIKAIMENIFLPVN